MNSIMTENENGTFREWVRVVSKGETRSTVRIVASRIPERVGTVVQVENSQIESSG